jgi:hypothetical protein
MLEMTLEEKPNGPGSIVHLDFSGNFQMHTVEKMKEELDSYLADLAAQIGTDVSDSEKQGMQMVQQIIQQLYPHILKEELDLSDTFIIEIADEAANDSGRLKGNA